MWKLEIKVILGVKASSIQQEHLELYCNEMVGHKMIHIYTQMTDLFLSFFPSLITPPDDNPHFPKSQRLLTLNLNFTIMLMLATSSAGCIDNLF